jgi:peptide deformylase
MGTKKLKYIDSDMFQYEIYDLVDKYDAILYKPTEEFNFNGTYTLENSPGYIALSLSETMQKYSGLGLSANQVGLKHKVCAINMGNQILIMFNPVIVNSLGVSQYKEGCISFPGLYLKVNRAEAITVKFQKLDGEFVTLSFDGISSVCVQHEIDHLNGICYTSKVSPIVLEREKNKVKKNLKKMKKVGDRVVETA